MLTILLCGTKEGIWQMAVPSGAPPQWDPGAA